MIERANGDHYSISIGINSTNDSRSQEHKLGPMVRNMRKPAKYLGITTGEGRSMGWNTFMDVLEALLMKEVSICKIYNI